MKAGKIKLIVVMALIAVVAVMGLSGIYRVNEGEQAVVLTFGELSDTKGPGMYWRMPLVKEVRAKSTTQLYTMEYGFRTKKAGTTNSEPVYEDVPEEAIMLTSDQNIINAEIVYQFKVTDVASYLYQAENPAKTMQSAFETVLRRNMQNHTLDDAQVNKEAIATQVLLDFREILEPYRLGVTVSAVSFQEVRVPEEVKAAYEDVLDAMNEKTRNLDEAEKYQNQVVPNARAEAYKMIQNAEAYKAKTIAGAEGEVAEFNEVYAKYALNKDITRTRLLIETLQEILSGASQVYIVDDNGVLKTLSLNGAAAPSATPAATAAPEGGN